LLSDKGQKEIEFSHLNEKELNASAVLKKRISIRLKFTENELNNKAYLNLNLSRVTKSKKCHFNGVISQFANSIVSVSICKGMVSLKLPAFRNKIQVRGVESYVLEKSFKCQVYI
jgi:hypothetical protein